MTYDNTWNFLYGSHRCSFATCACPRTFIKKIFLLLEMRGHIVLYLWSVGHAAGWLLGKVLSAQYA